MLDEAQGTENRTTATSAENTTPESSCQVKNISFQHTDQTQRNGPQSGCNSVSALMTYVDFYAE